MARINVTRVTPKIQTHEGAPAQSATPLQQLRRSVLSCLLWETTFYEDGVKIEQRIAELCTQVPLDDIAALAVEARSVHHLRHVPLVLLLSLLQQKYDKFVVTCDAVIQRPDELTELLALYWASNSGKKTISNKLKDGLALAFIKFSTFQLSRYRAEHKTVALRDVLRLTHPKPASGEQSAAWKALSTGALRITEGDTWERDLSQVQSAEEKRAVWTALLKHKRLGGLALLRNLRNMLSVNVDTTLITNVIGEHSFNRVLPFRFIAAARYAPSLERAIEAAFIRVTQQQTQLTGTTVILVDVSGSMKWSLSGKSDMQRIDAACGLAMILREQCETLRVYTFSDTLVEVPTRRGFALRDAIVHSQHHRSTYLGRALQKLQSLIRIERLVVITDEQSHDTIPTDIAGYCINVAPYTNGVTYGDNWVHIDGFSESCVQYITEREKA